MSQRISSSASDHLGRGYPRPQLRRDGWVSLNGPWDFAFDPSGTWRLPSHVQWDRAIRVPFAAEAPASGVGVTSFFRACWYRRSVAVPRLGEGERLLLHFGAVDYDATVWVGGLPVGHHDGGYTPFTIDITTVRTRRRDPRDRRAGRGRPAGSRQAARQAGLAAGAALHLVSAHHRHLADGVARDGARHAGSATVRWTPQPGALGDRARSADRRGAAATGCASACGSACGEQLLADDTLRRRRRRGAPPHRAVAIPGSTTTATSCSGVPQRRR